MSPLKRTQLERLKLSMELSFGSKCMRFTDYYFLKMNDAKRSEPMLPSHTVRVSLSLPPKLL